jgi:hypothetical protein
MKKIDPKSPGQSTATDDFCDPHDRLGDFAGNPHAGMSRDSSGSFSGSAGKGGTSSDGEAMVAKYRPKSATPETLDTGYELNEDGDDWA